MTAPSPIKLPAQTPSQKKKFAARFLADHTGTDPADWTLEQADKKRSHRGQQRIVWRARGGGHDWAVKWTDDPEDNADGFTALSKWTRLGVRVPAPVVLSPDRHLMVSEWIAAPLVSASLDTPAREGDLHRAGVWLAGLHACETRLRRAPDMGKVVQRRVARFPRAQGAPTQAHVARFTARAAAMTEGRERIVTQHGDYKTHNVFAHPDGIIGFDFDNTGLGRPQTDLAGLLCEVEFKRDLADLAGTPWDGTLETDRRAFLTGYGALTGAERQMLDLSEDLTVLTRWMTQQSLPRRVPEERFEASRRALARRGYRAGGDGAPLGCPVRGRLGLVRWRARWFGPDD